MFTLHAPCKDKCQAKVGGTLARLRAAPCGRAMTWKPLGPRDPAPQAPYTPAKVGRVETREAQQVCGTWAKGGPVGQGVATQGWELGATPSLSLSGHLEAESVGRAGVPGTRGLGLFSCSIFWFGACLNNLSRGKAGASTVVTRGLAEIKRAPTCAREPTRWVVGEASPHGHGP